MRDESEWTRHRQGCCSGFSGHSLIPGFRSRLTDNAEGQTLIPQIKVEKTFDIFFAIKHLPTFHWPMWPAAGREAAALRASGWGTHVQRRLWHLLLSPTAGHWGPAGRRGKGDPADQRENQATDASRRCKFKLCFLSEHTDFHNSLLNLWRILVVSEACKVIWGVFMWSRLVWMNGLYLLSLYCRVPNYWYKKNVFDQLYVLLLQLNSIKILLTF